MTLTKNNYIPIAKTAIFSSLIAIVTGCTVIEVDKATQEEALRPLTCANEQECSLQWQRAQFWIGANSFWKLQLITDTILQTYTPPNADLRLGYKVMRERNPDGSSRIWVGANCGNSFGCSEHPYSAMRRFKEYVRTGEMGISLKTE